MNKLPYSDIFCELLTQIHRALGYCHSLQTKNIDLREDDPILCDFFSSFSFEAKYRKKAINTHLIKGLTNTDQQRNQIFPRLSKLTIQAYNQSLESKKDTHYHADVLPSPLNILYYALTDPEEPQTSAYPFVLCRSMLFYFLELHPRNIDLDHSKDNFEQFGEEEILNSISSFQNYIKIHARWPDLRNESFKKQFKINLLNGHLLSIKGITHLWFNDKSELINFCNLKQIVSLEELKQVYARPKYHFRLSSFYTGLPDSSEILNWIFGIPIPLRGADILFHGGLKKTSSSGLVISLDGQPGTGKTSASLSLAAVLSPFKTKTIYISLEEEKEDLQSRLHTLIPEYLKGLSIYQGTKKSLGEDRDFEWFYPYKIKSSLNIEELTSILKLMNTDLIKKRVELPTKSDHPITIPAICPLLIVIDNINEIFSTEQVNAESYDLLEKFIEQCRNMGAIVLLIAAEEIPQKFHLDYLVDVAIHLKQSHLDKQYEKPVRILQLVKTRHQVSRQGSHVFHISNSRGFRISPQVPSQIDKKEKVRIKLPSEKEYIHTLNFVQEDEKIKIVDYLPIAANSQILVHGYGSSGKAGFGLKLLLTPYLTKTINSRLTNIDKLKIGHVYKNKVLIVSFLYPEEYYDKLVKTINKQFSGLFEDFNFKKGHQYFVKAFFPGYLTPEDFIYKIVRLLDEANLEGQPFTGILLDGLHNVFLQFKNLQESHMIWPLLYSILSRYNLTVVSTFTNFSLTERHIDKSSSDNRTSFQTPDDFALMQQGQRPFLHGLVKAADYYFLLEEIIDDKNDFIRNYWLSVRSSIRQTPPNDFLQYNRQKLTFTRIIPSNEIYNFKQVNSSDNELKLLRDEISLLNSKVLQLKHDFDILPNKV